MATMSMNKAIHEAIRRDLDRFVGALARFSDGDAQRAQGLWRAWGNFDHELTRHHLGEHEIAWPALQAVGVAPTLLAAMDAEHEQMAAAIDRTRAAMDTLRRTAAGEDAEAALAAFRELQTTTVAHMNHEEEELEPVYQDNREAPEIKAMGKAFGKVSPSEGGRFFAWLVDGATPEVTAAVSEEVPRPVMVIIGGIFGRSYRKNIAPVWSS
jgi:Hemerythrin HHE cation binding domain